MRTPQRRRLAFTMLELAVTFAVVGVLAGAVAFGVSAAGRQAGVVVDTAILDRVVQAELRMARDFGTFTAWPDDLRGLEASDRIVAGPSTGPYEVSAAVGDGGGLGLAVLTSDGTCARRLLSAPASGAVPTAPEVAAGRPCTGAETLTAAVPGQLPVPEASVRDW